MSDARPTHDALMLLKNSVDGVKLNESHLKIIRAVMCAPGTRADLRNRSGLAASTITTEVRNLIRRYNVLEERPPGRRIHLTATNGVAVGLGVGVHRTIVVARQVHDVERRDETVDTPIADGQHWLRDTTGAVRRLVAAAGGGRAGIATIGMAVPWAVNPRDGRVSGSPPPWSCDGLDTGLTERLTPAHGKIKVLVGNDALLTANAEQLVHRSENMLFLQVSGHVLGGTLVGDRLLQGHLGLAGQLGHLPVDPHGEACWCGRHGCLEGFVKSSALMRDAIGWCDAEQLPRPRSLGDLTDRAEEGDAVCLGVLRRAAARIGQALAMACLVGAPELIVIGGEAARGLELARDWCAREMTRGEWTAKTKVVYSTASDAPANGALLLGLLGT
ncbi:ROK family protein [Sphaerisporangium aureirubrum]|uniref:ROK family protein n=1 Tax=Sphaerisporangium aureirubrum TaxID=1544736 RepID=A0ABW1NR44_9ACTN